MTEEFSPKIVHDNANIPETEPKASYPMRVLLISNIGEMLTILLPSSMDGRYRFTDSSGLETYPLYVEQKQGCWTVMLEQDAQFIRKVVGGESQPIGQEQQLVSGSFIRMQYKNEQYILYAEEERPEDHIFLPYTLEKHADYVIGRSNKCHISYRNPTVSREHAVLHWNGKEWEINDKNSTNGTYVNGKKVQYARLRTGDIVFIVGLYIVAGSGYIAINNKNDRVTISTPWIHQVKDEKEILFSKPFFGTKQDTYFDRLPRKIKPIGNDPIEIDMPPVAMHGNNIPLLLRLGSPMLMGGRALASGNVFMAMTSMAMPMLMQGFTEKDRREYEKKRREGYTEYLSYMNGVISDEKKLEETNLNFNYPPLNDVMYLAHTKRRLWDRRQNDEDFLKIRIGNGQLPLIAEKKYPHKKFQIQRDDMEDAMYELAERQVMLDNVPVMHSLVEDYISGISGDRTEVLRMVRNMILQIIASHSYDEVKIAIIAEGSELKEFEFVRYLPHNWSDQRNMRFFVTNQSEAQQLTNYFNTEFEEILSAKKKYKISSGTSYVVFALSKELYTHMETFKSFLEGEDYMGMSIVAAFEGLPKECKKVIDVREDCRLIDYLHIDREDLTFRMDAFDNSLFHKTIRQINGTRIRLEGEGYLLPSMITFLEMFNVGKVEHLNPLKRWEDNNPIKSLAAPVGVGTDGKPFVLDLHEKRQGPHGLVAGMTGSGKSEFLITYILSMAVNYSPDEVAFVLIDYKGGGLADAFEDKSRGLHLPHLVGTITNLDGAAIQRSLMSIKSELKRRQSVFKKAKSLTNMGTMDIYDYQKLYRSKVVTEPLPHLIIIADEFAEMKAQQPEFMNELISTARIGRSLGVHLILATQRPSGVVNDQIRSNTKFQVCLRVQDRSDSMDMIKRPDAAELKHTGRFYIQVGYNEFFAQGQSAWCGAEYVPQEEVVEAKDYSVSFVDNLGQTLHSVEPEVMKVKTGTKQIVAIAKYLSDLAERENIQPRKLWIDPLPALIDFDVLNKAYPQEARGFMQTIVGMADDPERQMQYPLVMDFMHMKHMFICGAAASGKSMLLRTMLVGLAERYTPEQFNCYIAEIGSTALAGLKNLPHCGAYVTETNESEIYRLFDFIKELIAQRKAIFAEADVTNYASYIQIAPMPLVLVVLDGFTNIRSLSKGGDYFNTIHEYLRDATGYGIEYIITCNNSNEITMKAKQEIDYKIALNAKDKYVFTEILDVRVRFEPPVMKGRGVCVIDGRPLEYQAAILDSGSKDQERAMKLRKRITSLCEKYPGKAAVGLPTIEEGTTFEQFCTGFKRDVLPLGYLIKDARAIAVPFQQLYHLSVYFGNPAGIQPIFGNFAEAARYTGMSLAVIRRQTGTVFEGAFLKELKEQFKDRLTLFDTTESALAELDSFLVREISQRNVFRDEYSRMNGIPLTEKGRALRAIRYIRENTEPCMIIFESLADFCGLLTNETMQMEMNALLTKTRGYNIYFIAGFYPNQNASVSRNSLMQAYNEEEMVLFFGGQYDKQSIILNIPTEFRKLEQINPRYDRFVFKYRGNYHSMLMPCGDISEAAVEPDEASII